MDQFGISQKIVIVEDKPELAEIYKTRLELLGYTCFIVNDGATALAIIEKELPHLVLMDLMVPIIAGDQILKIMRSSTWGKNIPVLVISALSETDAPDGLRDLGIEGFANKSKLTDNQLDILVDNILKPANQTEDVELS